ncbi:lysosomal proton-coupled steroid conjugate and bile acid symporter SLC46A3 [Aplochiton taeniatus]
MGCVYLIEPVVGIYAFSVFMTFPLLQQYVYRRLWQQLSGAPYPEELNITHCHTNDANLTSFHGEVQKEASLFFLHSQLCFLFPSLLSAPLLVSYSDHHGRKAAVVPPLVGDMLFAFAYFLVSAFSLRLDFLLGASFLTGVLGGPTALVGGCFAYVADRCQQRAEERLSRKGGGGGGRGMELYEATGRDECKEKSGGEERGVEEDGVEEDGGEEDGGGGGGGRTVRMAGLDMILGVLSGLASLATGFYIRSAGFTWPFLSASLLHLLNLAYVVCVLRESLVPSSAHSPSPSSTATGPAAAVGSSYLPKWEVLIGQLQGVYLLFAASTRRRKTVLGLMLMTFALYKVSKIGGMSIFILFELNAPLCWSEVYVGYGSALTALIYLVSFAGVSLLSRCLPDVSLVLLGLLSVSAGLLMAAFANTTLLMFLMRLPLLLSVMPTPVLRSMMSRLVRSSEQGALFACVAFVEMLSVGVAVTMFNSTYAATVSWLPGFSFLLASSLTLIPAVLIG